MVIEAMGVAEIAQQNIENKKRRETKSIILLISVLDRLWHLKSLSHLASEEDWERTTRQEERQESVVTWRLNVDAFKSIFNWLKKKRLIHWLL